MYIHEAIQATSIRQPYVRRRSWDYLTSEPVVAVKIQPTNSPDGCVIVSTTEKKPRYGWQPTARDLVADDWEPVGL